MVCSTGRIKSDLTSPITMQSGYLMVTLCDKLWWWHCVTRCDGKMVILCDSVWCHVVVTLCDRRMLPSWRHCVTVVMATLCDCVSCDYVWWHDKGMTVRVSVMMTWWHFVTGGSGGDVGDTSTVSHSTRGAQGRPSCQPPQRDRLRLRLPGHLTWWEGPNWGLQKVGPKS